MVQNDKRFQVVRVGELRKLYHAMGKKPPPIHLDPAKVPEPLRPLIPLAEKWGISDDILRMDALDAASSDELAELRRIVASHEDLLEAWLAGPESYQDKPTPEYIAFASMVMAADGC
jgi:hypothetical protein